MLFRKHSPHHIAGVLSMVCNGADYFSQPDQVHYGNGIYFHAKNLPLNNFFEFVDFTFLLVQCVNYILDYDSLSLGVSLEVFSCFGHH